jgi:hypothetical protein
VPEREFPRGCARSLLSRTPSAPQFQGSSYVVTCNDAVAPTGGNARFYLSGTCSGAVAYSQSFTNGACLGFSPLVPQIRSISYNCTPPSAPVAVSVAPAPVAGAPLPSPAASQAMLPVDTSGGSTTALASVCTLTVALCSAFILAVQRL